MKTGIIIALILIIGIGLIFINKNRKKDSISDKLNTRAKGTIFYHEDDFCQIQLLPDDNLS